MDTGPVVWPVLEPLHAAELARRFARDWLAWYGPVLAPHARLIGDLLAAERDAPRRRPRWAGAGARPWPAGWVLPVVRRRGRRLRLRLPPGAPASWWPHAADPGPLPPRWLAFEWRGYWGARCDPGSVSAESVRWSGGAGHSRAWLGPLAFDEEAPDAVERRLRDGVGLVVVQPWLGGAGEPPDQPRRSTLRPA